ncbi:hypothetical protein KCH_76090 [Kitasatospora cheerisanensis KCTC 2395]|uniref:Uncharacterized protein n=1 Tax=Kitasatospora cheerisanensis KCTC 2395 TaxID=1348663 RepID=A0A066YGM2_9ACTN|nr:hypothetical protein KCH_76090 [Kitasatospora cheerisanensis KCTC 2395]
MLARNRRRDVREHGPQVLLGPDEHRRAPAAPTAAPTTPPMPEG